MQVCILLIFNALLIASNGQMITKDGQILQKKVLNNAQAVSTY